MKYSLLINHVMKICIFDSNNRYEILSCYCINDLFTITIFQLNRECNSRGNVRHVLNEFFTAVLFHIYLIWRTQNMTIKDSGFLIKGNSISLI